MSFPRGEVRSNSWGQCVVIEEPLEAPGRPAPPLPGWIGHPGALESIACNLKLVRGIGPVTERRLRDEGYSDVYSLQEHPRWGSGAQTVIRWIEERDWASLLSRKASDLGLLGLCDPEHTVFLDIETTGLSASAPLFMVGMLLPASSGLRLCQIFARDYDEEPAVLEEAVARLSSAHAVVTYNGRCFDVPFIHRRLAYHGRDEAFTGLVVDLLTHTRRAYRSYLPNCRLATVQTSILGTPREGDIPSELIPELYPTFVRTGDADVILPVIDHNELDLLAMADLLPRLA